MLTVSDEDKKIALKSYHEKLSKTEFDWDRNDLFKADIISSVLCLMVRESLSKVKNEEGCRTISFNIKNGKGSRRRR